MLLILVFRPPCREPAHHLLLSKCNLRTPICSRPKTLCRACICKPERAVSCKEWPPPKPRKCIRPQHRTTPCRAQWPALSSGTSKEHGFNLQQCQIQYHQASHQGQRNFPEVVLVHSEKLLLEERNVNGNGNGHWSTSRSRGRIVGSAKVISRVNCYNYKLS